MMDCSLFFNRLLRPYKPPSYFSDIDEILYQMVMLGADEENKAYMVDFKNRFDVKNNPKKSN